MSVLPDWNSNWQRIARVLALAVGRAAVKCAWSGCLLTAAVPAAGQVDPGSNTLRWNQSLPLFEITLVVLALSLAVGIASFVYQRRAAARDVAERKRAEEALRKSQERLLLHVLQTPLAVIEWDLDFTVVDWNPAAERIFGFSKSEALGRHAAGLLVPEEVRPHVDRVWQDLLERRGGYRSNNENMTKDGRTILCEWHNTPLVNEEGEVIGVVSLVQDVTERRQAEQAVRESEEKYRSLFEHATYGIYRATLDGRFLAVNPALVQMLGYDSIEELLQIDLYSDLYDDPAARDQLIERFKERERAVGVEVAWKRKDGARIVVRLSGRPWHDSDGEVLGFEMIVEDVTSQRVLEEQLRQAQKMEAVGQLTGGIAHDFNNLLSVMLANCQLMENDIAAGKTVPVSDVRDIAAAAQRAATMTRQLLGFSRRADLKLVPTDLSRVLRNFTSMLQRVLPETIELQVSASEPVPYVQADSGAVEQMILNLATNARDAMPDGGRLIIDVGQRDLEPAYRETYPWAAPGRYVCVSVSDSGVGMRERTQAHAFEPFFTTKRVGEGTGLGLAMVYGLAKQHDGFVQLYSEAGLGTTFRLYFPVTAATPTDADGTANDAAGAVMSGKGETILLVEDEEALRKVSRRVLERHGYEVIVAGDGAEALDMWRANPTQFDLVVSDLVMPNVGGAELARALSRQSDPPKILLVSGYSGAEMSERNALDPHVPLLPKPWSVADLLRHVRELLDE